MARVEQELVFTVTIRDCRVDTFTVGGNGGSGKDTSNTGVRITHPPSGAVGKATDTRSQAKNRAIAFKRMGESAKFQKWAKAKAIAESADRKFDIETKVNTAMGAINLKVEYLTDRGWVEDGLDKGE